MGKQERKNRKKNGSKNIYQTSLFGTVGVKNRDKLSIGAKKIFEVKSVIAKDKPKTN